MAARTSAWTLGSRVCCTSTEATTAQEMSRSKERRKPTRHSGYRFPQRELRTIAFRMKDCFLE